MGKTGTKGSGAKGTVIIATVMIVSAVCLGFRQLWREGVFSETKPVKLTQSRPAAPSPSRTQSPPQMTSLQRPPQGQFSPQMQQAPQMPPSSRMQPPSQTGPAQQMQPSAQMQPPEPQTASATETKPDPAAQEADFQAWFQEEMQASEYEQAMQDTATKDANAPEVAPSPAEKTEPNASQ